MANLFFDFVDLRLFVNIAQAKSLTRGAEQSHLSLAAASMRIKNLEDALGTKLFTRTSRGVTLTPAGDAMLRKALPTLQQAISLQGTLLEFGEGVRGHIRLFANTTAITEFLPSAVGAYLAKHPQVDIKLEEHSSQDIVRAVSEGAADIGIVAGNVHTESLTVLPFHNDRLALAVAPHHPLAVREQIMFEEALDYDFVARHSDSAIHAFMHQIVANLGVTISIRIKVSSFDALCRMVEANVGIGVLPQSAALRHMQTMDIKIVELKDAWAKRETKICVQEFAALPPFARELVDHLVATVPAETTL